MRAISPAADNEANGGEFDRYAAEWERDLRGPHGGLVPRLLFGSLIDTDPALGTLAHLAKTAGFVVVSVRGGQGHPGLRLARELELRIAPAAAQDSAALATAIVAQFAREQAAGANAAAGLMLVFWQTEQFSDEDLGFLFHVLNRLTGGEVPISAIVAGTLPTLRRAIRAWPDLEMFGRKFCF
jgi:hypothetical protein